MKICKRIIAILLVFAVFAEIVCSAPIMKANAADFKDELLSTYGVSYEDLFRKYPRFLKETDALDGLYDSFYDDSVHEAIGLVSQGNTFLSGFMYCLDRGELYILEERLAELGIGKTTYEKFLDELTLEYVARIMGDPDSATDIMISMANELEDRIEAETFDAFYGAITGLGEADVIAAIEKSTKFLNKAQITREVQKCFKEAGYIEKTVNYTMDVAQFAVITIAYQDIEIEVVDKLIKLQKDTDSDLYNGLVRMKKFLLENYLESFSRFMTPEFIKIISECTVDEMATLLELPLFWAKLTIKAVVFLYPGVKIDDLYMAITSTLFVESCKKNLEAMESSFQSHKATKQEMDDYELLYESYLAAMKIALEKAEAVAETKKKNDSFTYYKVVNSRKSFDVLTYEVYIRACMGELKKYLDAHPEVTSSITISGENAPTTLNVGDRFWFKGTITSAKPLSYVYAAVKDANGNAMTSKKYNTSAKSVNIASTIDEYLIMQNLPAGKYTYYIEAKDSSGYSKVLHSSTFTVVDPNASASSITISGENAPTTLNVGDRFWFKGTVTSAKPLSYVYAAVKDKNGNAMTSKKYSTSSKSVNIASTIDEYLIMQNLPAGKYTYYIEAKDSSGYSKVLHSSEFTVVDPNAKYTVSYNANGGSGAPGSQTKTYGKALTLSSTKPTRSGYNFDSWNTKADGSGAKYSAGGSYTANSNVTLYAQWKAKTYTVTYNANGGSSAPTKQTKTHGKTLTLSSTKPTRSGYDFNGWNTKTDGSGTKYSAGGSFTSNSSVTLYAQWKTKTYTVTYNANGGSSAPAKQTKTHGKTLTLSSTKPTRSGYTFNGWNTKADGSGTKYSAGGSFTSNSSVTLYAQWKKNSNTGNSRTIVRLAGKSRTETAVAISKSARSKSTNIILASGDNYADALAGVPLAYALDAPILLVRNNAVDTSTLNEIKRLGAKNIYILGGTGAINDKVQNSLKSKGYTIERIAGADRFATAVAIAKKLEKLDGKPSELFFVYAYNYPDALSVGNIAAMKGAPVLYVNSKGTIDSATGSYTSASKAKKATIIGGTGVISSSAEKNIKAKGVTTVSRIAGSDRYETCVKINKTYASLLTGSSVCVATGLNYPDALAGSVFAASKNAPMVLVNKEITDTPAKYVISKNPKTVYIFGETGVVSQSVENALKTK